MKPSFYKTQIQPRLLPKNWLLVSIATTVFVVACPLFGIIGLRGNSILGQESFQMWLVGIGAFNVLYVVLLGFFLLHFRNPYMNEVKEKLGFRE